MRSSSADNIIDRLYVDHQDLVAYMMVAGESSLRNSVDNNFRRTLAVASASFIEAALSNSLIELFSNTAKVAEPMVEFVCTKAVDRRYHDLFDWSAHNANKFFRAFGEEFRLFMVTAVNNDSTLDAWIKSFLELGQLPNELVHQNFAVSPLEKTVEEIYALYGEALLFVEMFPSRVETYIDSLSRGD